MQHYHYTNINHTHDVDDPGHRHEVNGRYVGEDYGLVASGYYTTNPLISNYTQYTTYNTTGITVKGTGDSQKFSSGALANDQWAVRTETDAYGWATPTAINIVPKYQAVYTWYRES